MGAVVRISKQGRITIPKSLRDRYGLHSKVEVEFTPTGSGILIRKKTMTGRPVDGVYGIFGSDALGEGVSVDDYVEEIRGR